MPETTTITPVRKPTKKQRAIVTLEIIKRLYPNAECSLNFDGPLQLMIATILAAQCTDERVNKVTPALFDRYPDATAFAEADLLELETYVKSTGFYHNKAKNIRAACQRIMEVFGGEVPRTMEDLTSLPGVARKTANVVSSNGYGLNLGFTVDTHVTRLANRLGFTKHQDAVKIERDLMKLFPQDEWENTSIHLIYHGREVCDARKPLCEICELTPLCPSAGTVDRKKELDRKSSTAQKAARNAATKARAKTKAKTKTKAVRSKVTKLT
jgi:endonuclease-3